MASPKSRLSSILCAAGLAVAAVAVARPLTVSEPADCPAIDPPMVFVPSAGVRVFIDPATGKIRPPTPAERQAITEATGRDRSKRTYALRIRPDGTQIVELDDAFLMSVMATAKSDGTISYHCVTGPLPLPPPLPQAACPEESR